MISLFRFSKRQRLGHWLASVLDSIGSSDTSCSKTHTTAGAYGGREVAEWSLACSMEFRGGRSDRKKNKAPMACVSRAF